jgi:hypothetical protein
MSTNYPNQIDTFVNPNPDDKLGSVVVPHAELHTKVNEAIIAIQNALGSGPAGSNLTATGIVTQGTWSSQIDDITIDGGTF